MVYSPPTSYPDLEADGRTAPTDPNFFPLEVPKVGTVMARHPMPNAIHALGSAARADIDVSGRADYLMLFVQNHVTDEEMDRLFLEVAEGNMPEDTFVRVSRAIATWDTARPTRPSSRSAG